MKRKIVLGIVLLTLIAMIGMVSAASTGTTDIQAALIKPTQSLTLTITGGSENTWVMDHVGWNTYPKPYYVLSVINVGYTNGYKVYAADKQNSVPPPPSGYAGHMCKWSGLANRWSTSCLDKPLEVKSGLDPPEPNHELSGTNLLVHKEVVGNILDDIMFSQNINPQDEDGNYRIIVTFTAMPN